MSPSKTWFSTSLDAESEESVGFRMEASPLDTLMKRVSRPGSAADWSSKVGTQK